MEPASEFADYVDDRGRCVRHWSYGSGHRPLIESREGPEGFDPPFGSGDVLVKLERVSQDGVAVYAQSYEHYRQAVLELAAGLIKLGVVDGGGGDG